MTLPAGIIGAASALAQLVDTATKKKRASSAPQRAVGDNPFATQAVDEYGTPVETTPAPNPYIGQLGQGITQTGGY